jgi:hypothetical protein
MWLNKHMSNAAALTEAKTNAATAKSAWENAKSAKARRNAAEELEFWTNKVAMLNVTKGWA